MVDGVTFTSCNSYVKKPLTLESLIGNTLGRDAMEEMQEGYVYITVDADNTLSVTSI